jgi:hypothetical protein
MDLSRGLGDVYKRQAVETFILFSPSWLGPIPQPMIQLY